MLHDLCLLCVLKTCPHICLHVLHLVVAYIPPAANPADIYTRDWAYLHYPDISPFTYLLPAVLLAICNVLMT